MKTLALVLVSIAALAACDKDAKSNATPAGSAASAAPAGSAPTPANTASAKAGSGW